MGNETFYGEGLTSQRLEWNIFFRVISKMLTTVVQIKSRWKLWFLDDNALTDRKYYK